MMAMLRDRLTTDDVERITGAYFLEGPGRARALSSFWVLLVLSAVIASAGVVADSTATVIGAMIVAPLMRPIVGAAAAIVLARRHQIMMNIGLMVTGAMAVVAVGYLLGVLSQVEVTAATNSQVAGRVHPRLIDLVAALATGIVGVFAVVRSDISDTLPGVAIAISLVPPLAVVGLTLESGAPGEATGALLLFGTNVAAIIATSTVVFLTTGLRDAARESGVSVGVLTGRTLAIVAASVVVVTVPLGLGTRDVVQQQITIAAVRPVAEAWADQQGWEIADIVVRGQAIHIVALGPNPEPDPMTLRADLDAAGVDSLPLDVTLVEGVSRRVPVSE